MRLRERRIPRESRLRVDFCALPPFERFALVSKPNAEDARCRCKACLGEHVLWIESQRALEMLHRLTRIRVAVVGKQCPAFEVLLVGLEAARVPPIDSRALRARNPQRQRGHDISRDLIFQ